ncbi:MAG: alkaline phosphatase family protein [Planctomycetota bacterium]
MSSRERYPKFVILSIDGVPCSLVRRMTDQGDIPNLSSLASDVGLREMRSVHPTVSCVAWSSYMTGQNPGKHGIYGFIDRQPGTYDLMFPNSTTRATQDVWSILSRANKRVFGMNVPTTYPPQPVNGTMIGGFLSPSMEKVAYPVSVGEYLRSIDYRIDNDAALARKDKRAMLDDLHRTLDARMEAMFHFLESDQWDFFHTHIMGSDRINHFLWEKMEQGDPEFAPAFFAYYRRIDEFVGRLLNFLPEDVPLMVFSDHGFCAIEQEVQLSRYLIELGWTSVAGTPRHPLSIDPEKSRAYCLIPGRVFVNLAGREPQGIVPLAQYQQTREQLRDDLMKLRDPKKDRPVIRKVLMREQVYWPAGCDGTSTFSPDQVASAAGTFGKAADLIAIPYDGYDLKLGLAGDVVFKRTELEGMHTYEDAFIVARGVDLPQDNLEIMMLARPILEKLKIARPADMDGLDGALTDVF